MRLVSWIGNADIEAVAKQSSQHGAVASTLKHVTFSEAHLLNNYTDDRVPAYLSWLADNVECLVTSRFVSLSSPIDFHDIYIAADRLLTELVAVSNEPIAVLLSPGTPAMQAMWILLGKTKHKVSFYQSTLEQGVQQVDIPFEIAAEFIPKHQDQQATRLATGQVPTNAAFDDIVTQNPHMIDLKQQATTLAARNIPVLIYGESGTGKELFATAIHNASPRANKPFIAINCGAIPPELIDSTLFGHVKGAFTGAANDRAGCFQQADGGTLFLDEFGELEPAAQVRLLRALQSGEIQPVGAAKTSKVDVRLITATNKDLMKEVVEGRFREDLFYRAAIGVLHLPPLREREGDLLLLSERILESINTQLDHTEHKKLYADAKNLILKQPWRGNIRELQSTLLRASLSSASNKITAADIQQALFAMPEGDGDVLGRDISQGVDIKELISEVIQHYIPRAIAASPNKSKAAKLLGFNSFQTFDGWKKRHGIK